MKIYFEKQRHERVGANNSLGTQRSRLDFSAVLATAAGALLLRFGTEWAVVPRFVPKILVLEVNTCEFAFVEVNALFKLRHTRLTHVDDGGH